MDIEIDKSKFGFILLINKEKYIITGYDFLAESYLAVKMSDKSYCENREYIKIYDDIKRAVPFNEIILYMDAKIKEYSEIDDILKQKNFSQKIDLAFALSKIKNCYKNVFACEDMLLHSRSNKDFYNKELNRHNKGLRRAISKLHKYLTDDEYFIFCEYLRENKYELDINFISTLRRDLVFSKGNLINNYDKIMKELRS